MTYIPNKRILNFTSTHHQLSLRRFDFTYYWYISWSQFGRGIHASGTRSVRRRI